MTAIWINERDGDDSNDGLTPETALRTHQAVQRAIDIAGSPGPRQDIVVYMGKDLKKDEQIHTLQMIMVRQDKLIAELVRMCKLASIIYRHQCNQLDPDKIAQERASWEREIEAMDALIEKAQKAL